MERFMFFRKKARRAGCARPSSFQRPRLRVEALEDRLAPAVSVAGPATDTWSGAGPDALWSDAANWGGVVPVAGDDLVFAAGAAQLPSTNDFAAGTAFNSITFQAGGYSVNGNAITLLSGLFTSRTTGTDSFNLDVTLGSAAALNATLAGTGYDLLDVSGAMDLGGCTLNTSLGFASSVGNTFTLIHATSGLTGTFNGLANGAF